MQRLILLFLFKAGRTGSLIGPYETFGAKPWALDGMDWDFDRGLFPMISEADAFFRQIWKECQFSVKLELKRSLRQ